MKIYAILYTYSGYDGEIDRLIQRDDEKYLAFQTRELAEQYKKEKKLNDMEYEIVEVEVVTS